MKQSNYIVMSHRNIAGLVTEVNQCLSKGFICQGGLSISLYANGNAIYSQALVKEVTEVVKPSEISLGETNVSGI